MRNPERQFYKFPLEAASCAVFFGFTMTALIMFLSNDSLTFPGMMLLLLTLVSLYLLVIVVTASICGLIWRIIWEWPKGTWCFPLIILFVIFIYSWNYYQFRLFLRFNQKFCLLVELGIFFILFLASVLSRNRDHTIDRNKRWYYLIFTIGLLVLVFNSSIPSLRKTDLSTTKLEKSELEFPPIYLFGIDGADWDILLPLHRMGKIPNVSYFIETGSYSLLNTFDPTSSPLIWTTIATGKDPFTHGVRDFGIYILHPFDTWISILPKGAGFRKFAALLQKINLWEFRPSSAFNNRSKTIWQIANDYGIPVAVSNWPVTVPVKPVKGYMFGETEYLMFHDLQTEQSLFPSVLGSDFFNRNIQAKEDINKTNSKLGNDINLVTESQDRMIRDWSFFRYGIAKWPVPLRMIYTHSLDMTQHIFWRFGYRENMNVVPDDTLVGEAYSMIENHIVDIDHQIGSFFETLNCLPYVMFISDHGFRTIYFHEKLINRQSRRVQGVHDYSPQGIFLLNGPAIIAGNVKSEITVFDITPTLLDLMSLPQAEDMVGNSVLPLAMGQKGGQFANSSFTVHTYETASSKSGLKVSDSGDLNVEAKLKSLGYIE